MTEGLFDLTGVLDARAADRERRIGLVVAAVRRHPGWVADEAQDRALAVELMEMYPTLDLPKHIAEWRAWMAEFEPRPGKGVRLRVRVLRWFRNQRDWVAGTARRAAGAPVRRTRSSTPRTAADFADVDGNQFGSW